MDFTAEQMEKAKACATLEEFQTLAKAEGFNFSDEEAETYFKATRAGALSDDDLDEIAGGKSWEKEWTRPFGPKCPFCGTKTPVNVTRYTKSDEMKYEWSPNVCTCGAAITDFYYTTMSFIFVKNGGYRTSK